MIQVLNPFDRSIVSEIQEDTTQEIKQKWQESKDYFKTFQKIPIQERIQIVEKVANALRLEKETLARTLTQEMGKPINEACSEIENTATRLDWFCANVEKTIEEQNVFHSASMDECVRFEALGVIGNISAWNYPFFVSTNVIVPAILTGNCVLFKPSEICPLSGKNLVELFYKAGLPKEALQLIQGGANAGEALCELNLDGMFFTGSYKTGAAIAKSFAGRMTRLGLELGGKDPVYVCDDADANIAAASLVEGAFYNAGQGCCSVERIYVHENIYENFCKIFEQKTKEIVLGNPLEKTTQLGPISRKSQLDFLQDQLADALGKGAKLIVKGGIVPGNGLFFKPTVVVDVTHEMKLMRDESFGPVVGIMKVKNDDEALHLMADTPYGLTAGVFSKDKKRAENILKNLNVGTAYWNCCDRVSPNLPWSGRGSSGIGSTMSKIGILSFVQPKAWHFRTIV